MPLGGFATSRSPLAAVAARGAVDNINDDVVGNVGACLEPQCLCILYLLLRATDTLFLAIRDLETFYYSPLRGNILGRTFLCVGAWALYRALDRPGWLCVHQSITGNRRNCTRQSLAQLLRHGL